MKKLSMVTVGAAFLVLGTISTASAVTVIDTCVLGGECGNRAFGPFGESNANFLDSLTTIGQTFTVPDTDNVLTEFSFLVSDTPPGEFSPGFGDEVDVVDFRAFVMEWDDISNTTTESVLFESETRSTTIQNNIFPLEEFTFSTGGLNLTSTKKYVAFVSVLKDLDGLTSLGWFGDTTIFSAGEFTGLYLGGDSVYTETRSFAALTDVLWVEDSRRDAAFKAKFVAQTTAESDSAFGLLAFGTLGAISLLKRSQLQS